MPLNCPNILSSGVCRDPQCRFEHNIRICDACTKGQKHQRARTGGVARPFGCPVCQCTVDSVDWQQHSTGRGHLQLVQNSNIEPTAVFPAETHTFCRICRTSELNAFWDCHIRSARHMRSQRYAVFSPAEEVDEYEVAIEGDLDFGILEPMKGANGVMKTLKVSCPVPLAQIVLVSVKLSSSQYRRDRSPFSVSTPGPNNRLSSNPIVVTLRFSQEFIGRYQERIELHFEDQRINLPFIVCRDACAIIGDRSVHEELKARTPYMGRAPTGIRGPETQVIEGRAPPSLNAIPYARELPKADIPNHLLSTHRRLPPQFRHLDQNVGIIQDEFLPENLGSETHGRHFKNLLWVEEYQMEEDLETYDMKDSILRRDRKYYYLDVPGLAENRPSVLIGDRILVRKQDDEVGHWFAGHVHVVRMAEVGLVFHESFGRWKISDEHYVRFKLNRIPLRRQHQALDTVFAESRILLPDRSHLPLLSTPQPPLRIINQLISTNPAQLEAVASVVAAAPGTLPFIIFGPPGTGKTITVVEAIIQLVLKKPNIRILACTPSNSAADLIAIRLAKILNKEQLFRLYAPSRPKEQVPDSLQEFAHYRYNGVSRPCFAVPPMATMKKYRVIVSTLISASIFFGIGMPRGHFSHIIIDEAGQATEPEAFVPIKTMADSYTNIVLSGDPKQLGPIIHSRIAAEIGLGLSYLERLISLPVYDLNEGRGKSITKLVKNFRSHEAILSFPNKMFYNNDLQTCGNPKTINAYLNSAHLPNGKFPIVFHCVYGKDEREARSPSFFNIDEATQAKLYIEELKSDRKFRTTDHDIGIISPYHAQCVKIRNLLRGVADEVKVGSVEEFQGQERKVIIISTVRSTRKFVGYDIHYTLGFVANPRRFNVSVTRAQALLIIIGDPNILGLDPMWKSFLNYIYLNEGWRGPDIPWDHSEPVGDSELESLSRSSPPV